MNRFPPLNRPFRWFHSGELSFIGVEPEAVPSHFGLAFSTRLGGVSDGPFARLNLGFKGGDDPDKVLANRSIFADGVGLSLDRLVVMKQVHRSSVIRVGPDDAGRGARRFETAIGECDGQATDEPGLGLSVSSADCVPLALFDPVHGVSAALHIGWRGLLAGIIEAGVQSLADNFGAEVGDLSAFSGPSIGPCCFEVGRDVADRFADKPGDRRVVIDRGKARPHVDLPLAVRLLLKEQGVPPGRIYDVGLCTACRPELFYSYRRDGVRTGSQMMWAWRKKNSSIGLTAVRPLV